MTTISIPNAVAEPDLTPLPMAALMMAAWNLFDQACDLVPPVDVTVSDLQDITLQFSPVPPSLAAITHWAMRFGGVLQSKLHQTEDGPQMWVTADFTYYGVRVHAFAHIRA